MMEVINSYHVDYWIRNKIIDCSEVSSNNQLNITLDDANLDITDNIYLLNELDDFLFNDKNQNNNSNNDNDNDNDNDNKLKKKLNNNCKYSNSNIVNESKYQYNHYFRNSKLDKSNMSRTNSNDNSRKEFNRIKNTTNRVFIEQKSNKYISIYQKACFNFNKRTMQTLPKNSRIHEYASRERKVLLDSFSKPKLK